MIDEEKAKYKLLTMLSGGKDISLEKAKKKLDIDDNFEVLVITLKIILDLKVKRNTKYGTVENITYLIKFANKLVSSTLIINKNKIEFLIEDCIKKLNQGINVINDAKALKLLKKQVVDLENLYNLVDLQHYQEDIGGVFDSIVSYVDKVNDFDGFRYLFDKNKYLFKIKEFGSIDFLEKLFDKFIICLNNLETDKTTYYKEVLSFFLTLFRGSDRKLLLKRINDEIIKLDEDDNRVKYIRQLKDEISYDFGSEIKSYLSVDRDKLVFNDKFEKGEYINLTDKKCITIDRKGARSLEDGIIFEKFKDGTSQLISCISDANMYVKENSTIDAMAYNLGENCYFGGNQITMLPSILAYNHCSLNKGFNRFCYAYVFRFDSDFNVIGHSMYRALVNVDERYTYNEIDKLYQSGSCPNGILDLIDMAKALKKQNPEMDKYHQVKSQVRPERYPDGYGALIVTQIKVLLNSTRAELFLKEGLPYIYRNNITLDQTKALNELISNAPNSKVVDIMSALKPTYGFSTYSNVSKGHAGIGKGTYAHMSIPVRNYAALFNQRMDNKFMLCKSFTDKDVYFYEEKAKQISLHLNEQLVINKIFEKK